MRNRQATQLLFELSQPGSAEEYIPATDLSEKELASLLPAEELALQSPPLPEVSEPVLIRHFINLSQQNMSVDTHFYPLGSCTMKYNPKRNDRLAQLPGFQNLHPYQPEGTVQGLLGALHSLQEMLAEIAGMDAVTLQPAAGAQGELTALLIAAAYFRHRGEHRNTVLIPDVAHGTNPASAAMAGFRTLEVKSNPHGLVDLEDLQKKLNHQTAVFMITNPNTLGLFETQIRRIADMVHEDGGLVYMDGANMNATLGIVRPGDCGADMMHFNPHKTFSGPHGGGGPGAGPVAVKKHLADFLPIPVIVKKDRGQFALDDNRPLSIGKVRSFYGNIGVLLRAYAYIRTQGADGLRRVSERAVLNANYLLSQVRNFIPVPHGSHCMHEFVASALKLKTTRGLSAMDIAKRLLDYGFHAPTVYFPLVVKEALMIEPTETESKATLDAFVETLRLIIQEPSELVHEAPHTTLISRPDEVQAARKPILKWTPPGVVSGSLSVAPREP